MKKQLIGLAALVLIGISSAHAAIFNFAAVADGDDSYGIGAPAGESGAASFTFLKDGISVTTSGFDYLTNTAYFAYLDEDNAGLGVCKELNSDNECKISSDDNVTLNESLKLVFDRKVTINTTSFRNGNHGTDFTGSFDLTIDSVSTSTNLLTHIFSTSLTGREFVFSNLNTGAGDTNSNNEQFYISAMNVSAVPIPAAVWLFGSALLGLAGFSRRKA